MCRGRQKCQGSLIDPDYRLIIYFDRIDEPAKLMVCFGSAIFEKNFF